MSDNTLRSEKWRRLERGYQMDRAVHQLVRADHWAQTERKPIPDQKGNNGISRDLAELITAKYPSVSKGWLLTGEGEMLIGNKAVTGSGSGIPYYGMDATVAVEQQLPPPLFLYQRAHFQRLRPECHGARDRHAARHTGRQHRAAEKWDVKAVVPGESYLIISAAFKGFRIIRRSEQADELLLLPRNAEEYDPISIKQSSIEKLFIVRGIIIKENFVIFVFRDARPLRDTEGIPRDPGS